MLYSNYQSYNRCNCTPTEVTYTSCPGDCVETAEVIIGCNQPIPLNCGNTFVVPISEYNDYSVCEDGYFINIVDYDTSGFDSVVINSDEDIEFTVADVATNQSSYFITYQVTCSNTVLGGLGDVEVCMTDFCADVTCDEGESCDPCTGNCA